LTSRHGSIQLQALVTDRVFGNELFVTENATRNDHAINLLTSYGADKDSDTPAFKEIAVYMELLDKKGESPLPPTNFRFGHPTPRDDVQADLKWRRDDYTLPPDQAPHPEKF
jgi:formate dehydrogenase major subunit